MLLFAHFCIFLYSTIFTQRNIQKNIIPKFLGPKNNIPEVSLTKKKKQKKKLYLL